MPNEKIEYTNWREINSMINGEIPTDNWLTDCLLLLRLQNQNQCEGIETIQPFEMMEFSNIDRQALAQTNFFLIGNN